MSAHHLATARSVGRRSIAAGGALLAFLLVAAAGTRPAAVAAMENGPTAGQAPAAAARVEIKDYAFSPATLTVPAGTTVTWINRDDEIHTVTASQKLFASEGLDGGDTFAYTFATPGTYAYHCALHGEMTATIVVK